MPPLLRPPLLRVSLLAEVLAAREGDPLDLDGLPLPLLLLVLVPVLMVVAVELPEDRLPTREEDDEDDRFAVEDDCSSEGARVLPALRLFLSAILVGEDALFPIVACTSSTPLFLSSAAVPATAAGWCCWSSRQQQ